MRAKQFIEAAFGTNPKRPARAGSRPDRGHEPQQRYVTDRKTGKQYNPDEEFNKTMNSPEVMAQMKRMATKEEHDEFADKDLDYLQSYYSDFHKDLHGFRPRHHSEEEWNDPEVIKSLIHKLHDYMDKLKQSPEGRAQLKADGWVIDEATSIDKLEEEFLALSEHGKASRELCKSSTPDEDLGASALASCKSQGLRARDGNKSHKLGKTAKSRVKVGGHKIKGRKYGGPLPDWS